MTTALRIKELSIRIEEDAVRPREESSARPIPPHAAHDAPKSASKLVKPTVILSP